MTSPIRNVYQGPKVAFGTRVNSSVLDQSMSKQKQKKRVWSAYKQYNTQSSNSKIKERPQSHTSNYNPKNSIIMGQYVVDDRLEQVKRAQKSYLEQCAYDLYSKNP